jgi:ribosomal-protein-alanine N-acetyltransferase
VLIRPATIADVASMIGLERQSESAAHWTEQQYEQLLVAAAHGEWLILVADESRPTPSGPDPKSEVGQGILGFLVARQFAPEWELENLVTAPAFRRKGVGKRLLDTLFEACQDTKSKTLFLEVRESNTAARAFYGSAGFEPAGRRKAYYRDPVEDAILYRRSVR